MLIFGQGNNDIDFITALFNAIAELFVKIIEAFNKIGKKDEEEVAE